MVTTGLRRFTRAAALCAVFGMLLVVPASAQIYGRNGGPLTVDGEPTDPERAYPTFPSADVDVSSYGLSSATPQEQAQAQSWFDALLDILRNLGLLPAKGAN
jgi:hypothetical protein